jgi:hypothetical protein
MNYVMEIHDSRLTDFVIGSDKTGYLLWHAYIYRYEGDFATTAYESGWQNVRFTFTEIEVEGVLRKDEYSSDGDMSPSSRVGTGMIDLPADHDCPVELNFNLSPEFLSIKIRARSMRSILEGSFDLETSWLPDGTKILI